MLSYLNCVFYASWFLRCYCFLSFNGMLPVKDFSLPHSTAHASASKTSSLPGYGKNGLHRVRRWWFWDAKVNLIIHGIYFHINCIGFSVWSGFFIRPSEVRQNLISLPTNYIVKKARKQCKKHCENWGGNKRLKGIYFSPYTNLLVKSWNVNLYACPSFSVTAGVYRFWSVQ